MVSNEEWQHWLVSMALLDTDLGVTSSDRLAERGLVRIVSTFNFLAIELMIMGRRMSICDCFARDNCQ